MEGSFERGIRVLSQLLSIRGKVLPPSTVACHICAELEDGTITEGEVNVRGLDKPPIKRLFLKPESPPAYEEAVQAILDGDIIVIGPGSLFTSVLANILVPGIRDALAQTTALKIYVCNIVTQPGQTDGFTASDHLRAVLQYTGADALDCALFNSQRLPEQMVERYRKGGAESVPVDEGLKDFGPQIAEADLVEDLDGTRVLWEKQDLLRHQPDKLADTICRVYVGLTPART